MLIEISDIYFHQRNCAKRRKSDLLMFSSSEICEEKIVE